MNRISIKTIELLSDPDIFLGLAGPESVNQLLNITKTLYDARMNAVQSATKLSADILSQLFVENFDNEQIFQQLELLNDDSVDRHQQKLAALKSFAAHKKKNKSRSSTETKSKRSSAAKKKNTKEAAETKPKKKTKTASARKINGKKQVHFMDGDDDDDVENKSDPADESGAESVELEDVPVKKSLLKDKFDTMGSDIEPEDDDEDESEEEKELKKLLEKATAKSNKQLGDDGSDEESDVSDLASDDDGEEEDEDDDDKSSDSDAEVKQKDSAAVGKLKDKLRSMNERQSKVSMSKRKSVVDDRFFKLSEMEAFLDEQDLKEQRAQRHDAARDDTDTEDEDDEDDDDDQVETAFMYNDFFDPPPDGVAADDKDKDAAASDDDEEDVEMPSDDNSENSDGSDAESAHSGTDVDNSGDSEQDEQQEKNSDEKTENISKAEKTAFEKRQEKLKTKITELEEGNLKQKPWQMSGEVPATARPENSLLQENIDFEFMTRQAPVITETTTTQLEQLILQRIKDKAWDDVERKARPTDKMVTYSKRVVLDQEKNKMSLSQIYEQQFLKQIQKSDDGAEKVDPKQVEIKTMMQSLFVKLDALANFHYTPKPVVQDVKIVSNVPALSLEEAIPSAVSDAALLAPEEVEAKGRHELIGSTEMTSVDRRRARRLKKKKQKAKQEQRENTEKQKQKEGKTAADTKGSTKKILAAVMAAGGKVEKAVEGKSRKRGRMKDLMETGGKLEKRKKMKLTVSPAPKIKKSRASGRSSR